MSSASSTTRSVASSTEGHDEKWQSKCPCPTFLASHHASTSSITTKSSSTCDVQNPFLPRLSTFQLLVVHIGSVVHHANNVVVNPISTTSAALTLFLATTDAVRTFAPLTVLQLIAPFQTIVSTSLPTIASDLKASPIQYTWVGVAYMLTQTAFQPLYGRASDLVGRKVHLSSYLSTQISRLPRMFYTLAWPFLQWAQLYVELLRFVLIPPSDQRFSISLLVY